MNKIRQYMPWVVFLVCLFFGLGLIVALNLNALTDAEAKVSPDETVIRRQIYDAWSETIELLRKLEPEALKLKKELKILAPVKTFEDWVKKKFELIRGKLIHFPDKMAPRLEGLPWHKIKDHLEKEINDIFEALSGGEF